jgi:hypothetical protein
MREHLVGAARLLRLLRRRLHLSEALEQVKRDMARREERFLSSARDLIYARPESPYRKLLLWAGCAYSDLEDSVRQRGIDETAARLAAAGVYVSFDELKGRAPIVRPGFSLEVKQSDFDPPRVQRGITASTSGSRSAGTTAIFDWDLIEEHAATELMLAAIHGALDNPKGLWLPVPPGLAGIHAVLLYAKAGCRFDRWFTQVREDSISGSVDRRTLRLGTLAIRSACRLRGCRVPESLFTPSSDAQFVARWLAGEVGRGKSPMLRTYASAAVRIARAAAQEKLNVTGALVLTGGEPLTDSRRAFIEAQGMRCYPRYSAADAGLIGAACDQRTVTDEMHLYETRFSITSGPQKELLLTTLTPTAPKVLFNTSIGDTGEITARACGCLFGQTGMQLRVMRVQSSEKITHEGVNVSVADLERIAADAIVRAGGSPADFQLWSCEQDGLSRLKLAVSPSVRLNPGLEAELLERLSSEIRGGALTSALWAQGSTIEIVRREPIISKAQKMHPLVRVGDDGRG